MVFSNGDTYTGDWVDGKRTGERASNQKPNHFLIIIAKPCDPISSVLAWLCSVAGSSGVLLRTTNTLDT